MSKILLAAAWRLGVKAGIYHKHALMHLLWVDSTWRSVCARFKCRCQQTGKQSARQQPSGLYLGMRQSGIKTSAPTQELPFRQQPS